MAVIELNSFLAQQRAKFVAKRGSQKSADSAEGTASLQSLAASSSDSSRPSLPSDAQHSVESSESAEQTIELVEGTGTSRNGFSLSPAEGESTVKKVRKEPTAQSIKCRVWRNSNKGLWRKIKGMGIVEDGLKKASAQLVRKFFSIIQTG